MACKHFGPRYWLAFITCGFGITTFCLAFVSDYRIMYFLRVVLGAFEAGIQPGIMYSYSQFYRRHEMVGRWGIKAAMASVAGSFGGLLSAGLANIPRAGLLNRWRWIFLIEGLMTFAFSGVVL
jgi:MFS family permease